jgi:hypothetical protein
MTAVGTFPSRGVASHPARSRLADAAVFVGAAVILWLVVRVGGGMGGPWTVAGAPSAVSTDPFLLPYYAARSLLRMFAALGLSLVFTFFTPPPRRAGAATRSAADGRAFLRPRLLTAENLRNELMTLWTGQDFPTKAICLVTHNIEEAIVLADRVIVLSSNPGHILAELPIELERPRDRRSPSFEAVVDKIYGLLTGTGAAITLVEPATATRTSHPLPLATVGGQAGLVEIVHAKGGRIDLPDIAADLCVDAKDLLPLVDAAALLDFVRLSGADLELTSVGKDFTTAGIQVSKTIFAEQARTRAPLVRAICNALHDCPDGNLRAGFFLDILQRGFSPTDAQQQLDIAIGWGRYAELFDYDTHTDQITAEA